MRSRPTLHLFSLGLLLAGPGCGERAAPRPTATEVTAKRVIDLPSKDPLDPRWATSPELMTKLLLQDQAPPKLDQPGVEALKVRALHDGKNVAFRLEWTDDSADELVAAARFGDMVAIQLPLQAGADVPDGAMGQLGRPVRITLWRASRQHQLRTGLDPIAALYPNAVIDHYPVDAAGPHAAAMGLLYAPARANDNPVAMARTSPTEDLIAEGFGSLSPAPTQVSDGIGAHEGKTWRVVITRPLDAKEGEALRPGVRTYAAFAVWQGAAGNVGSRKMRSAWVPLAIDAGGGN